MPNNTFEEIWEELMKSKNVLMMLHPRPDGDSLGSCTAMKYVLESRGINSKIVSQDKLSENLYGFEFSREVTFGRSIEDENLDDFDAIVFLDYSLYGLSQEFKERLKRHKVINIDHHSTSGHFGNLNYIEILPSCCSILFDFFKDRKVDFDKGLNLRLLLGMCTDTAFFLNGDSIKTMEKAIFLLKSGELDYKRDIYDMIMDNPWNLKKLHGVILQSMKKEEINGKVVAYGYVTIDEYEKCKLNPADVRIGIACMEDIKGLDLVFLLTELDGNIKGSFRSRKFDTTVYSSTLGGGGHKLASGFEIKNEGKEKAIEKVIKVIREKGFVYANQ